MSHGRNFRSAAEIPLPKQTSPALIGASLAATSMNMRGITGRTCCSKQLQHVVLHNAHLRNLNADWHALGSPQSDHHCMRSPTSSKLKSDGEPVSEPQFAKFGKIIGAHLAHAESGLLVSALFGCGSKLNHQQPQVLVFFP